MRSHGTNVAPARYAPPWRHALPLRALVWGTARTSFAHGLHDEPRRLEDLRALNLLVHRRCVHHRAPARLWAPAAPARARFGRGVQERMPRTQVAP